MKFGVGFPHDQTMLDPGAVRSLAQAIEGLGYSYLTAADHVVGADLTNADFENANLTGADLRGAKLASTRFTEAVMERVLRD